METLTDTAQAAEILQDVLRRRNARRPEDLKVMIQSLVEESQEYMAICDRADFLYTGKGEVNSACVLLDEIRDWLTLLRNHHAFLQNQVESCRRTITKTDNKDDKQLTPITKTSMTRMLQRLTGDFDGWRMERSIDGWYLVVLTRPVALYCEVNQLNVEFGRYMVKLNMNQVLRGVVRPYRVYAETPLLAPDHSTICHPHVRDASMCEGDGELQIGDALKRGDLFTFFILIDQVLRTYNHRSPFLRLEYFAKEFKRRNPNVGTAPPPANHRRTHTCIVCGHRGYPDDMYTCAVCENAVCRDCSHYCDIGDVSICGNCRTDEDMRNEGCEDCDGFGTTGCAIRESIECGECGTSVNAHDAIQCRSVWRCTACVQRRADDRRTCCADFSQYCPLGNWLAATRHPWHREITQRAQQNQARNEAGTGFAPPEQPETGRGEDSNHPNYVNIPPRRGITIDSIPTIPQDEVNPLNFNVETLIAAPTGTRMCATCSESFDVNEMYDCSDVYFCAGCLENAVNDNEPCCEDPTRQCAYGHMLRRLGANGRYEELPSSEAPQYIGAIDPGANAGTGFGPPADNNG